MAFRDFPRQQDVVQLLQRSLERGRLGHAYLLNGEDLGELEDMARTLAKVLNCEQPPRRGPSGLAIECCDACLNCRKIDGANHPDVLWLRPESKTRVIVVGQMRELLQSVYLKPTQARFKLAVVVGADRLNTEAANKFLKTLEEPPADSILVLLSTEPQRILETIISRCLRLNFSGEGRLRRDAGASEWLTRFAELAGGEQKSLLGRYQLLAVLMQKLNQAKEGIKESLTKQSPLEQYDEVDSRLKEKWEDELTAAIESEYRRQRLDVMRGVQLWLRDVWLEAGQLGADLLAFPQLAGLTQAVARRVSAPEAMENLHHLERLQGQLNSNVQEALALEVALLKLKL